MVVPGRTSADVDGRISTRLSMQSAVSNNDEYTLAMLGISDGEGRPTGQTSIGDQVPPQSGGLIPPPRPSSTTKPRYDSFALQHDGGMGPAAAPLAMEVGSSSTPLPIDRSSTVSSDVIMRPESLYQGPSAPSHPYQMYPQQARLARTASVATTSTAHVSEMSYAGPTGLIMAHPYRGDPQNTASGLGSDQRGPAVAVPLAVGFPGRNNNYQRRLGPDGEEIADLIGPDGHTEQLPPYTQYADEAFARKTRPNVQVVVPGAGGMGLATRNPEFASREDLSSPQSRRSVAPSIMSDRQLNTPLSEATEKPKLKKWQQVARRKVCGIIPIWVFVLIAICFVLFGIILGTVLALLKPPNKPKKSPHPPNYTNQSSQEEMTTMIEITMTTTLDASPFKTIPTGIPALPTGSFILPVNVPAVAPAGCIADSSKTITWSCSIQPFIPYTITIASVPGKEPLSNNQINLDFDKQPSDFLPYGSQPPELNKAKTLRLVNDSQNPERGPAWFFQNNYDKLVILPETALTASAVSKRHFGHQKRGNGENHGPIGGFVRKNVIQAGEKPWFCYWNNTLLELFIYVNQSSVTASQSFPPLPSGSPGAFPSSGNSDGTPTPSRSGTNTVASSVPTQSSQSFYPNMGPPMYPKLIKVEERRVPLGDKHVDPYCVQHIANLDGTYQPILDATGNPTTILLDESNPVTKSSMQGRSNALTNVEARDHVLPRDEAQCGCVWMNQ